MNHLFSVSLVAMIAALTIGAPANAQYSQNDRHNNTPNGFHGSVNTSNGFHGSLNGQNGYQHGPLQTGFNNNNFNNNKFYGAGSNINATQGQLQTRISQGIANGRLNQQEAARLQAKLSQLAAIEAQMRASGRGLSFSERAQLTTKLNSLSLQVTKELNDFDGRRIGYWTNNNNNNHHKGWR